MSHLAVTRMAIAAFISVLLTGCVVKGMPPWVRDKMLYGANFRADRGDFIEFQIPTSEGVEKDLLIGLCGGMAMPGKPVEPVVVSARIPWSDNETPFLSTIREKFEIHLRDSRGREFRLKPAKIVGGSELVYEIEKWGDILFNAPDYRLHLKVKLECKGKTYIAERSYSCSRVMGVKDSPMRADTPTPAKGWRKGPK